MKRVLVFRFSAMGDVAMTSPVVWQVCRDYPDAKIVYVTAAFFGPFFHPAPNLELFPADFKGKHRGLKGLFRLFRELRAQGGYDVVVDLHQVIRSRVLRALFALTGTRTVGIRKGRADKRRLTRPNDKRLAPLKPMVRRYADTFARAGFPVALPSRPDPARREIPEAISSLCGLKEREKWIGIAPFAQHKGKIYPLERMEGVVSRLCGRPDCRVFVFGGGSKEKAVAEYLEGKYARCVRVIGRLTLKEELDLIANLDCMVCMDSSALHMASLLGVRAVSVWGATHPYAGFYGYGQEPEDAVQADLPCRPCSVYGNRPCYKGTYECMTAIPPERIVEQVLRP